MDSSRSVTDGRSGLPTAARFFVQRRGWGAAAIFAADGRRLPAIAERNAVEARAGIEPA